MRHVNDQQWDDALEGALRLRATELRTEETARADTDAAWARLVSEREHRPVVSRSTARVSIRRRAWVPVISVGLVAATIVALVWLSSRPTVQQPSDVSTTTVTATTATTSTTPSSSTTEATPNDSSSALILPTFPDGRLIASLSAVSDTEWFALSDFGPEGSQSSGKLWHTTDAGATWEDMQLPDGLSGHLTFADPMNGWLIENQTGIYSTHDGGITWAQVDGVLPRGDTGWPAVALSEGRVYIVADVEFDGSSSIGVMSSPVDRDEFVWNGTALGDPGSALTPNSGQLVVRGSLGWAIAYGVSAPPGAARWFGGFDSGWESWIPPCVAPTQDVQPTNIRVPRLLLGASSSGENLAIVCEETTEGTPLRTFVSEDRGATFVESGPLPDGVTMTDRSWMQLLDDGTMLVGVALESGEVVIERSDDNGASWTVDTSFGGVGEFTSMTITPTGRIVVVAAIEGADGERREVVRLRDEQGTWFRLGNV